MDGLWKFIAVDSHEAVKVGDLHRETRSNADELTLRAHEEGVLRTCIDTSNVGDQRWGPPLVDAEWHAFCQAIFSRNRRTRVGCHVFSIQGLAPSGEKARNLERMKNGKVLWAMKEARNKGWTVMTRTTKNQTRAQFRLDLSAIHLRSPTAALVTALEGLEQGESVHL